MKKRIPILIVVLIAVITYALIKITKKTSYNEISGSGTIEITEVDLSSKLSGRIEKILCEEGSAVNSGQLLVVIAHDELNAQLNQANANLQVVRNQIKQADSQFKNIRDNLKRAKEMIDAGSFSQQQFDATQTQYDIAKAQLSSSKELYNQALAQINFIKSQIDNAFLYTPISGIVLQKNSQVGEVVFPGMSIITVGDIKKAWLKIYVPAAQLGRIKINDKAVIKVDSFPDKNYEGEIVNISSQAEFTPKNIQTKDDRTRLVYAVKINLNNENEELKPGMPADAVIYSVSPAAATNNIPGNSAANVSNAPAPAPTE